MFITKRKVRRVIVDAINAHSGLKYMGETEQDQRDAFMYQCGELTMALHILQELGIPGCNPKGEANGKSNRKRKTATTEP